MSMCHRKENKITTNAEALAAAAATAASSSSSSAAAVTSIPFLGISGPELACYGVFWAAQVYIVCKGIESIRVVEQFAAPLLIVLCVSLFCWAYASVRNKERGRGEGSGHVGWMDGWMDGLMDGRIFFRVDHTG